MNVDKYCEDGLMFDVIYEMKTNATAINHFIFPIDYTEEKVQEILINEPYKINVKNVVESNYVLKVKPEFSK